MLGSFRRSLFVLLVGCAPLVVLAACGDAPTPTESSSLRPKMSTECVRDYNDPSQCNLVVIVGDPGSYCTNGLSNCTIDCDEYAQLCAQILAGSGGGGSGSGSGSGGGGSGSGTPTPLPWSRDSLYSASGTTIRVSMTDAEVKAAVEAALSCTPYPSCRLTLPGYTQDMVSAAKDVIAKILSKTSFGVEVSSGRVVWQTTGSLSGSLVPSSAVLSGPGLTITAFGSFDWSTPPTNGVTGQVGWNFYLVGASFKTGYDFSCGCTRITGLQVTFGLSYPYGSGPTIQADVPLKPR